MVTYRWALIFKINIGNNIDILIDSKGSESDTVIFMST